MGVSSCKLSKTIMIFMIRVAMTCSKTANNALNATGWVDLPSGFMFLPPSTAKNERKNKTNTTETAKEEVATEKVPPATEGYRSNCRNNKHSKFWQNEALEMGRYEMPALFIMFGLVISQQC
jgi:hypothetical protein